MKIIPITSKPLKRLGILSVFRYSNHLGSLFDLLQAFPTEQSCIEHYEKLRWSNGVASPYDLTFKAYNYGNGKYHCKNTGLNFNVKTGTLFQDSKVP